MVDLELSEEVYSPHCNSAGFLHVWSTGFGGIETV